MFCFPEESPLQKPPKLKKPHTNKKTSNKTQNQKPPNKTTKQKLPISEMNSSVEKEKW